MSDESSHPTRTTVAIIGSGFGGIATAIRLMQSGVDDFIVFERGADVGGVWRDNTYPGCACDVHSHLYSLSFAPNPGWSRRFSPQPEIWQYLRDCADRFGVRPRIRFGCTVDSARWNDETKSWRLATSGGEVSAQFLVAANGALSEPALPNLPGLADFQGDAFHSARWRHDVSLAGKRVAVLGTGASAVQFIPAIQPTVGALTLFQRTAPWVVPRNDAPIAPWLRAVIGAVPGTQAAIRGMLYGLRELYGNAFRHAWVNAIVMKLVARHLRMQVADPELRAALTPHFDLGCKRVLVSDDYYPALTQPNVRVVPHGARAVTATGVVGDDGVEHPADVIIFGTGFHVADMPFASHIIGRAGQTLNESWHGSPKAHLGTTVHDFPNLFLLQGPNTGLGHSSVLLMIEAQVEHLVAAIRAATANHWRAIEPTAAAQQTFIADVDRAMATTVWMTGGCRSWYLDETGRNSTLWPGTVGAFRRRVAPFNAAEYTVIA